MVTMKQREDWAAGVSKWMRPERSAFHVVCNGGASIVIGYDRVCYGDISDMEAGEEYEDEDGNDCYGEDSTGLSELFVAIPASTCNHQYASFVMSLFPGAYVNSLEDGLRYGFEMNLDMPYPYLLGAMIAMRRASQPENIKLWGAFLEAGASEREAFFLCDFFFVYNGDKMSGWTRYKPDHGVFASDADFADFVSGVMPTTTEAVPAKESGYLSETVWDMWPRRCNCFPVAQILTTSGGTVTSAWDNTPTLKFSAEACASILQQARKVV